MSDDFSHAMDDGKRKAKGVVDHASGEVKSAASHAKAEASSVADQVSSSASDAASSVSKEASDLADHASSMSDDLKSKAGAAADRAKNAGADAGMGLANNIRSMADQYDDSQPQAAKYARTAADAVQSASEGMRDVSFDDLASGFMDLAKRRPAAVLVGSVVLGLALVKLFSSNDRPRYMPRGRRWL